MTNVVKFRPFPTTKVFSNGLLDDLFKFSIADFVGSDGLVNQPSVNILETNTSFKLEVAAPGYDKQDFSLNVENNQLTLSAKREKTEAKNDEQYTRREFRFESFERSFKLPETVNQEKVSAVYENGVLTITLPKKEAALNKVKSISIS